MFQRIVYGLRKAFRTNSNSDFESDKYVSTKKWEWSYLRVSWTINLLEKVLLIILN
jgi:hypothetical protein